MGKDPHRYVEKLAHRLHPARMNLDIAKNRCKWYRRRLLELSQQHKALHLAPAFSCLEIVDAIYHGLLEPNDTFLMSKGHGCLAQYAVLEELGYFDLGRYCQGGSLGAHPDFGLPGIAASTGSLGHGLGMAVGFCLADRLLGHERKVHCLISDGELASGSTWEALGAAQRFCVQNLVIWIDANGIGGLEEIDLSTAADKLAAFGCFTIAIDGHSHEAVLQAGNFTDGLSAVLCETVKGKGVSFMEGKPIWHYRSPNPEEYKQALQEIDAS